MIIGLTLAILLVITLLSVISGGSFVAGTTSSEFSNEVIVNGSTTTVGYPDVDVAFSVDPLLGGLAILTVIIAIACVIGLQVLGSGLNDTAVATVRTVIMYTGLWTCLSLLSFPLIASIEVFGALIYIVLTIGFVIGVFRNISTGG